jgi:hypothetical protein
MCTGIETNALNLEKIKKQIKSRILAASRETAHLTQIFFVKPTGNSPTDCDNT